MDTEDLRDTALHSAIEKAGGVTELAKRITGLDPTKKISVQGVSKWRRCPSERVLQVEQATGIPRHQLRPDLYPEQA